MTRGNLMFAVATLALSAAYGWMTTAVPVSALADAIGPRGLPRAYATLLAALAVMLLVQSIRRPARSRAAGGGPDEALPAGGGRRASVLAMLVIGVLYIIIAPWLGYLLSIAGTILATIYYQGGRLTRESVAVAVGGGVFFWLLFVVLMGIAQPPGIFPPTP